MIAPELAQATVAAWLKGYEFVPTQAHFARVPDLPEVLIALTAEGNPSITRARAVSAMIYAPDPRTEARLLALLTSDAAPSLLRRKAARALAVSYGARHAERVAAVFEAQPQDWRLREACARALVEMGAESLPTRRRLRLKVSDPALRAVLEARQIR